MMFQRLACRRIKISVIRKIPFLIGLLILTSVGLTWISLILIEREHYVIGSRVQTQPMLTEIPRRIHQIWFKFEQGGHPPPQEWLNASRLNALNNPGFEYTLWTSDDVMTMLRRDFPWFVNTYNSYPYDVQRTDVARYLILYRYGGVYVDFDDLLLVPLTEIFRDHKLADYDCAFFSGLPSGISNHFIISKRESVFMEYLISRLDENNRWLMFPYATVMWSTGPRFITARFMEFPDRASVFVMSQTDLVSYVALLGGASWHGLDGWIVNIGYPFLRLGRLSALLIVLVVMVAFAIGLLLVRASIKYHR